jgi:putative transposase
MKSTRAVKIKIVTGNPKFQEVAENFRDAANWLSKIVHSRKKPGTAPSLHKEFYATVREKFQLPSQVACSLFRHVVGTYRSMKSNGRWKVAVYRKLVIPVVHKRDFAVVKGRLTFWKVKVDHKSRPIPKGTWRDSKLKKVGNQWWLVLAVGVDIPEPKQNGNIVGVDLGQKNTLVAVEPKSNKTLYVGGGTLEHRRLCIRQTRANVASVGTRSAKRLMRRLSGREKAVTQELMHVASKRLVAFANSVDAKTIAFEDLAGVRKTRTSRKQRERNHRWPYATLQFFVGYKAEAEGIALDFVDPAYTSQGCSRCGHTEKSNRNGRSFRCRSCSWQDNADRNGACNIASRSILQRQASEGRAMYQLAYSDDGDQGVNQSQAHGFSREQLIEGCTPLSSSGS